VIASPMPLLAPVTSARVPFKPRSMASTVVAQAAAEQATTAELVGRASSSLGAGAAWSADN
jgi:hypothetical protein